MGEYATTTSLDTLMVGVMFDTETTALATICITDAENEVRKYLSKRYDLNTGTVFELADTTTAATPPIVTTWTEAYATGLLYIRQSRGGAETIERGEKQLERVLTNLKEVADYKEDVIGVDGSVISDKSKTSFRVLDNTSDYSETFNEDDPLDWKVDADKISDIVSERS